MGSYDKIYLEVKCPYCGASKIREIQTKDLNCLLNNYKVGDSTNTKLKFITGTTSCDSMECQIYMKKWELKHAFIGFGRLFNVRIKLEQGCVTNKLRITKQKEYLEK